VFVIRKKGDKAKKHKMTKKGDYVFIGDDENALIFIDGKESTKEEMKALGKDKIDKIEVLKGDKAIEKYGEKAKDGVIHITTKKE
jgi:outer membrane receptor for ferrienterochelin and colicin